MRNLLLLRHAKSSWDDSALDDFERPLSQRGRETAPLMASYMASHNLQPDYVLCSSAVRTQQTLSLVLPAFGPRPPAVVYDDALYLAEPRALLARLATLGGTCHHVLLVGHNPGLHALALELTGAGERRELAHLALGFPTAALASIEFVAGRWGEIAPGQGRLRLFVTPKQLA